MLILNEGELLHTDSSTDILEHYGVKGMKWGKRLFKSSSPDEKIKKAKQRIKNLKEEEKEFNNILKDRKKAKSPKSRALARKSAFANGYTLPDMVVDALYSTIAPVSSNRVNRQNVRRKIINNENYIDAMNLKKSVDPLKKQYKKDKKSAKTRAERKVLKDDYLNKKYNLEEAYWRKQIGGVVAFTSYKNHADTTARRKKDKTYIKKYSGK